MDRETFARGVLKVAIGGFVIGWFVGPSFGAVLDIAIAVSVIWVAKASQLAN